jgi:hypothetical protein
VTHGIVASNMDFRLANYTGLRAAVTVARLARFAD